jgi:uncharacterized protein YdaU (DUF1376 family)
VPATRYFKCFPSDFLHGLEILNEAQCALYVRLIFFMYDQGGPVPYDPQILKLVLKKRPCDVRKLVDQLVKLGKLSIDAENMIHNSKVDELIAKWPANSAQTSLNLGANGASKEPKSSTNSTRAHAHTQARKPDTRYQIRENSLSDGGNTAREPETLSQAIARRLAEARQEERAKEIGRDETSDES